MSIKWAVRAPPMRMSLEYLRRRRLLYYIRGKVMFINLPRGRMELLFWTCLSHPMMMIAIAHFMERIKSRIEVNGVKKIVRCYALYDQ